MPFSIVRDDIARVRADAIVNAANEQLRQGGGVCGAIFEAAGARRLQQACDEIGYCETGSAVATPAFGLHAKYVIHAVGPVWRGGVHQEAELLASCYRSSLELAEQLACTSIAFPLISAGIYGYPRHEALEIAQREIGAFLQDHEMDIVLVLYDTHAMELAESLRLRVNRYIDDVYVGEHARQYQRLDWEQNAPAAYAKVDGTASGAGPEAPTLESMVFGESLDLAGTVPDAGETGAIPQLFCPHCGQRVSASATSCPNCGARLVEPAESAAAPRPATPDAPWHQDMPDSAVPDAASVPAGAAPTSARPTAAPQARPRAKRRTGINLPNPLRSLLNHMDAGFSDTLLTMIDERGLTDAQVYKRANLSRQHFSKIRSNPRYQPTKTTVLSLAVALELNLDETQLLLERAGFALSHADYRDVIVEFFIREGSYDVFQINNVLFAYDQPLLGAR